MANKGDVELVVRAKNEATKSLGAVADAIKELTQQNTELGKSAEKADGLIGALSREVRDLGKTAAGLTQFEKIASSLDRATAAVTRTEQAFARRPPNSSGQNRARGRRRGDRELKAGRPTR